MAFFSVPALSSGEAQDEGAAGLNRFLAAHRVVSLDRQLVNEPGVAYWAICVSYLPSKTSNPIKKGRIDYKEVLSQEDFATYAHLRNLRKEIAEQEGVPAYAVFTNEQLAALVTRRIASLSDLAALSGVGPSRIEKYGERFLSRLKEVRGVAVELEGIEDGEF